MVFNHKLVNELLNAIFPLPDNFGITMSDYEDEFENFSFFKEKIYNIDPEASICYGVSKMVIISPKLGGVVIKIPFNGYFYDSDDNRELKWNPFIWATGSDNNDYCLAEYEKYKKLKTYGLDCFVAKVLHYKTINGVRIFLQEKAIPKNDLCDIKKASRKSQDIADKWYEEDKIHIDKNWIANCLDKYGKSKVERFLYYCENIDLDILEDMHGGNFGYRENNTPCIIDYSNYMD